MNSECVLCYETITDGQESRPINDGMFAHRECLLRSVLGGIGHLENHEMYCIGMRDPDGGRTYRQSALEVDEWVHRHGLPDR